jgi:hypothetical protein
MRRILALLAFTTAFSALALAENYSGKLLDASCYHRQSQSQPQQQQKTPQTKSSNTCVATSQTTSFAIETSGSKVYMLDAAGNSKAMTALKNRADRSAPGQALPKDITASVQGTLSGDTIKVDKIDVQ